ncbi:translation initiation factor IF-2-like isoform X2 [Manacus candei]|uniref:translation initiation factor IF-2-like isoform X2 n=1 Tax=Manacus candei TaxID=415023 RepID=UPI002227AC6E|nr:translation initiation factor IF-2-like isoform X2 [Manacus candei]
MGGAGRRHRPGEGPGTAGDGLGTARDRLETPGTARVGAGTARDGLGTARDRLETPGTARDGLGTARDRLETPEQPELEREQPETAREHPGPPECLSLCPPEGLTGTASDTARVRPCAIPGPRRARQRLRCRWRSRGQHRVPGAAAGCGMWSSPCPPVSAGTPRAGPSPVPSPCPSPPLRPGPARPGEPTDPPGLPRTGPWAGAAPRELPRALRPRAAPLRVRCGLCVSEPTALPYHGGCGDTIA